MTVSVPDELWAEAHSDDSAGPSDTVQRALRTLVAQRRARQRPLANAPDQANLDKYRPMFDQAVDAATKAISRVRDKGYRFGLLLAPGLTPVDFDVLDRAGAHRALQELVRRWGEIDPEYFSYEFSDWVEGVLDHLNGTAESEERNLLESLLGDPDNPDEWARFGVRWEPKDGGDAPRLSDPYTEAALAALRDVRDEATRHMTFDQGTHTKDG